MIDRLGKVSREHYDTYGKNFVPSLVDFHQLLEAAEAMKRTIEDESFIGVIRRKLGLVRSNRNPRTGV